MVKGGSHDYIPSLPGTSVTQVTGETGQEGRSYLMLMAYSAVSFTLCRTKNVPSERLVRMLSAPARSMGPAYLPRHTEERGPHSPHA